MRHNGTIVRQYRAASTDGQKEKRLAAICGSQFVKTAVEVSLEHQGLTLQGWICTPDGARPQNDIQHCFVNKRMMKDKLINHAIRQGYETALRPDQFAAYVLYIDIDPHQVDVNVHPAKHEVRFHQARLVHDFIYQAVADALMQVAAEQTPQPAFDAFEESDALAAAPSPAARAQQAVTEGAGGYSAPADHADWRPQSTPSGNRSGYTQSPSRGFSGSGGSSSYRADSDSAPTQREHKVYQALMTTPVVPSAAAVNEAPATFNKTPVSVGHAAAGLGKALAVVASKYLLLQRADGVALMDLDAASHLALLGQFRAAETGEGLKAQPLLIPQALPASAQELGLLAEHQTLLQRFGIVLREKSTTQMMVMAVCQPLRQQNLQHLVPKLMAFLASGSVTTDTLAKWLAEQLAPKNDTYGLSQAVTLITDLENCWQESLAVHYSTLLRPVDLTAAIEAFNHD